MKTIAHIINPFIVGPSSDLYVAQPITFETMQTAREFCAPGIEVTLYTAQYAEDRDIIPEDFFPTEDLERSILDFGSFKKPKPLPLVKDIIDRLYNNSTAEFLIYSHVDIALQPYFYQVVSKIADEGYDAFIINRRTITDKYQHPDDIPLMYGEVGEKHPGWDCFIFKRDLYPSFDLGIACIGAGWIGRVMIANMACLGKKFHVFENLHATFHIGCPQVPKGALYDDYRYNNRKECKRIMLAFEEKIGKLDRNTLPGRFFRFMEKDKHKYEVFEKADREKLNEKGGKP